MSPYLAAIPPHRSRGCNPARRVPRPGSGPSRPRPPRPSAHSSRRSLPLLQGARGLPSAALQSPPPPHFQTASGANAPLASLRFAPLVIDGLVAGTQKSLAHHPAANETVNNQGKSGNLRPCRSTRATAITRPSAGTRDYIYIKVRSGQAAAGGDLAFYLRQKKHVSHCK